MEKLSKKAIATTIDTLYYRISRACDGCPGNRSTQRMFADLEAAALAGEKEHIAFGRRLLGHQPSRAATLLTRVRYFVVKCVLDPIEIKSACDAYSTRRDFLCGAAIVEAFGGREGLVSALRAVNAPRADLPESALSESQLKRMREGDDTDSLIAAFESIDYAAHLAGG